MDGGSILLVLGGLASAVAILGWMGFAPNGPHIVAGIRACILAPRARRKALEQKVGFTFDAVSRLLDREGKLLESQEFVLRTLQNAPPNIGQAIDHIKEEVGGLKFILADAVTEHQLNELTQRIEQLEGRIADLETSVARQLEGMIFDHSPEAQRIKQAVREHAKEPTNPPAEKEP